MKRYLFLILTLFSFATVAQDSIYSLVTITNLPAINETIDINSDTRTWKATVTDPTTQIATGASIGASYTNMVLHFRNYPVDNVSILPLPLSTNAIRFFARPGDAHAVTIVTNWASQSYVTNVVKGLAQNHIVVDDLASMQALKPSLYKSVTIRYHTTLGDGGGGRFYSSDESLTDDGGTIIQSSAEGSYYWVREFTGPVYTEWWGANGGDVGDDTAAFNEAVAAYKHIAFLPGKTYNIDGTLTASGYWLQGPGGAIGQTAKIKSFSTNSFAITIGNNSTAVSGVEISGLSFHGGSTNNFGLKIRGNVDGVTIRDSYFNRQIGQGLHILGESNPIKNVRVVGASFLQGPEADDDLIQIDQSSSNNVTGVSFTDCHGVSTENTNNLLLIDSVVVTMSNCRWDVGTSGARVRLNKTQTTAPIIYGGQSSIVSTDGVNAIRIGFAPSSTAVGTLTPNILLTGNLEYNDASTTKWTGMAQPQFGTLQFLTATPEGSLIAPAGSLALSSLSGIGQVYFKGKNSTLGNTNWIPVRPDLTVANYEAVGDGVADDTAELNAAFAAVVNGQTVTLGSGKTYLISSVLTAPAVDNWTLDGNGSTIKMANGAADDSSHVLIQVTGRDGWTIKNLTLDGNRANRSPAGGASHALNVISQCDNWRLENFHVINSTMDGIYIASLTPTDDTTFSRNFNVVSCTISNSFRNGTSIINGINGRFERCVWNGSNGTLPQAGFDVESNSGDDPSSEIVFEACEFSENYGAQLLTSNVAGTGRVIANNCSFIGRGANASGAGVDMSAPRTIVKNSSFKSFDNVTNTVGIVYFNAIDCLVSGCEIIGTSGVTNAVPGKAVVYFSSGGDYGIFENSLIRDIYTDNAWTDRIFESHSAADNLIIRNNTIKNNIKSGTHAAIGIVVFSNGKYATISGNTIINASDAANGNRRGIYSTGERALIEGNFMAHQTLQFIWSQGKKSIVRNNRLEDLSLPTTGQWIHIPAGVDQIISGNFGENFDLADTTTTAFINVNSGAEPLSVTDNYNEDIHASSGYTFTATPRYTNNNINVP